MSPSTAPRTRQVQLAPGDPMDEYAPLRLALLVVLLLLGLLVYLLLKLRQ